MTYYIPGSINSEAPHTYHAGKYGLNLESHTHTEPTRDQASKWAGFLPGNEVTRHSLLYTSVRLLLFSP